MTNTTIGNLEVANRVLITFIQGGSVSIQSVPSGSPAPNPNENAFGYVDRDGSNAFQILDVNTDFYIWKNLQRDNPTTEVDIQLT